MCNEADQHKLWAFVSCVYHIPQIIACSRWPFHLQQCLTWKLHSSLVLTARVVLYRWMTSPEFQCGLSPPRPSADAASASSSLQAKGSGQNVRYYDDVYFSSGSEEEQGENGATATPPRNAQQAV